MQAITVTGPGGSDVLRWSDAPPPALRDGEVLLDVAAAGVNRADVLQRRGLYPPPPGASEHLGLECSGTVAAVADDVDGWAVGDEACALLTGGGYATRVAVPAGQLLPVPHGVTLVEAAALPEVVATVWSNVAMLAHLHEGETLLVHGGTSGIGTMAIQLGKHLGAHVVVTCGSAAKCASALDLGADAAIDYREQDFLEEVSRLTDGHGADVVLDIIGAKYLDRNVRALAVNGRLVVIGLQGGTKGELDLNRLLTKRAAVLATSLRARSDAEKAAIVASVRQHVWPLIDQGLVRPVIDTVLPITEAAAAHDRLEAGDHVGKIVLTLPS